MRLSRSRPESTSRALSCWAVAGVLAIAAPLVSSCDFLDDMQSWNKKPLTGERKALFPEGVPGVATGVPADVVKGYRVPEGVVDPAAAAAEAAAAEPARPRPKPQAAKPPAAKPPAAPPAQQAAKPSAAPSAQQAATQPPSSAKPTKRQAAAKPSTSPPADPNAPPARQAAAPASASQQSNLPGATPLPWPTPQPAARPQAAWPGDPPATVAR